MDNFNAISNKKNHVITTKNINQYKSPLKFKVMTDKKGHKSPEIS